MLSLQMKNLSTKIRSQKKLIFEITYYKCKQKKHCAIKCLNAFKNAKIKTNIKIIEQTKKEKSLKKKIRKFSKTANE